MLNFIKKYELKRTQYDKYSNRNRIKRNIKLYISRYEVSLST